MVSGSDSVVSIEYRISAVDYQVHDYESPLSVPDSVPGILWWIFTMPFTLVFVVTIPDCRRPGAWRRTFLLTFIMSSLWIGGLSWLLIWMAIVVGE